MSLKTDLIDVATQLTTAVNTVAAEQAKLRQQLSDALANPDALSAADKAEVVASFRAQLDRLAVLGQDTGTTPPTGP